MSTLIAQPTTRPSRRSSKLQQQQQQPLNNHYHHHNQQQHNARTTPLSPLCTTTPAGFNNLPSPIAIKQEPLLYSPQEQQINNIHSQQHSHLFSNACSSPTTTSSILSSNDFSPLMAQSPGFSAGITAGFKSVSANTSPPTPNSCTGFSPDDFATSLSVQVCGMAQQQQNLQPKQKQPSSNQTTRRVSACAGSRPRRSCVASTSSSTPTNCCSSSPSFTCTTTKNSKVSSATPSTTSTPSSTPSTTTTGKRKSGSPAMDPVTGKPKTTKRRPHSKSRHGCKTCKRRRVKCDETHPICNNCKHLNLECSFAGNSLFPFVQGGLNIMDIRLFHHYTTVVWKTIVSAGISNETIWAQDVPQLAFEHPYLMHSVLTFAANHFSRSHQGADHDPATLEQVVTFHRGDALRLLGEAVRSVTPENLDALVASSILLILDSLANASPSDDQSASSLPASAWLHHVRGAATILTAIGPPSTDSRFFNLVNVDLSDLAQGLMTSIPGIDVVAALECFDEDLRDLYPVNVSSPYYHALVYLDKLFRQRYKSDFILRVFSFPALLDRNLVTMLINGDESAKKIIRVYYKLVRSFTSEMHQSVWFLEGVSKVLPIDMDKEFGGLGFITQALPLKLPTVDEFIESFFKTPSQQQPQQERQQRLQQSSIQSPAMTAANAVRNTRRTKTNNAATKSHLQHGTSSTPILISDSPASQTTTDLRTVTGTHEDLDPTQFSLDLLSNDASAAASELESFASQFMLQATTGPVNHGTATTGPSSTSSIQLPSQPLCASGIMSSQGQSNQDLLVGPHSSPTMSSSSPLSLDNDYGLPTGPDTSGSSNNSTSSNEPHSRHGTPVFPPMNTATTNFGTLPHKLTTLMTPHDDTMNSFKFNEHHLHSSFDKNPNARVAAGASPAELSLDGCTTITPSMLTVDEANFLIKYEKS